MSSGPFHTPDLILDAPVRLDSASTPKVAIQWEPGLRVTVDGKPYVVRYVERDKGVFTRIALDKELLPTPKVARIPAIKDVSGNRHARRRATRLAYKP